MSSRSRRQSLSAVTSTDRSVCPTCLGFLLRSAHLSLTSNNLARQTLPPIYRVLAPQSKLGVPLAGTVFSGI